MTDSSQVKELNVCAVIVDGLNFPLIDRDDRTRADCPETENKWSGREVFNNDRPRQRKRYLHVRSQCSREAQNGVLGLRGTTRGRWSEPTGRREDNRDAANRNRLHTPERAINSNKVRIDRSGSPCSDKIAGIGDNQAAIGRRRLSYGSLLYKMILTRRRSHRRGRQTTPPT